MGYLACMTDAPENSDLGVPPLTGREPFFIVVNTGSGSTDADLLQDTIRGILDQAGRRYVLMPVHNGDELHRVAREAVELARREQGVVVAAGGDGTLNTVASAVWGAGVPFGILPQGTFNYFGRVHGVSQNTERATRALLDARLQPVQVGMLNDRLFLVNASLGLYPQLLEDRETFKKRFGRSRAVALWSGLVTLLRAPRQLTLLLDYEGQRRTLRTPTLVVGNNALQLEHIGMPGARALQHHRLVAMGTRPVSTIALYGLLLRGLFSRLGEAQSIFHFTFDRLAVSRTGGHRRIKVAMDGEIIWMNEPLEFKVAEQCLPMLVPNNPEYEGQA